MTAASAREFFQELPSRIHPGRLRGHRVSYRFEIEDVGTWRVEIDDGEMKITESDAPADCVVRASEETFLGIVRRERNPMTAFLTGKVKVEGDMGSLLPLRELLS